MPGVRGEGHIPHIPVHLYIPHPLLSLCVCVWVCGCGGGGGGGVCVGGGGDKEKCAVITLLCYIYREGAKIRTQNFSNTAH